MTWTPRVTLSPMTNPGIDEPQVPIIPAPQYQWTGTPAQPYLPMPPVPPKKKHTVRNVLLIVVAGLVALCGVGTIVAAAVNGNRPAAAPSASTGNVAPAALPIFNSPAQIIDYLAKNGLACGTESPVANPANGAFAMSDCGGEVVISRYGNPGAAQASMNKLSDLMGNTTGYAIVSGNWLLNLGPDKTYAQKVADLFHAQLQTIGGKTVAPSPTGPQLTVSQQQALAKAKDYLDFTAFSRTGLIKQLEFDGFSAADSTYAVDNAGADWTAEADAKAKDYMGITHFSHSGLVQQLEFDGFTAAQAEHGAKSVGL